MYIKRYMYKQNAASAPIYNFGKNIIGVHANSSNLFLNTIIAGTIAGW